MRTFVSLLFLLEAHFTSWVCCRLGELNHLEERLLDQAWARALYTPPPFLGSFALHTPRHEQWMHLNSVCGVDPSLRG